MITGVLIARNEASRLESWVKQMDWCDELILVDNDSTDNTKDRAQKLGMHVFTSKSRNFSELRNLASEHAQHEWLVYIDADEVVSTALAHEIQKACSSESAGAYRIRRHDVFWGQALHYGEVREAYKTGIVRVVRKDSGKWKGSVHETFHVTNGTVATLKTVLIHNSHSNIAEFLTSINTYSTIRAQELFASGVQAGWIDILIRPFAKFIYTYFLKGGFRDGPAGFVYAFMMSFHAFLVRGKLYLLHQGISND